jgi:hypothetical protein
MDISLPAVKTPTDVLAVVPYLLGFSPEHSIVVIAMRNRRVVFQARADVPPADEIVTMAGHLATVVARQRVDSALVVAYGAEAEVTPTVEVLRESLESRHITVSDALRADNGRYWSYVCRRPDCCPPEGTPYDVATTTLAAEATYAGLSPAASRRELVGRLAPVGGLARIAMYAAAERADVRLSALVDNALVDDALAEHARVDGAPDSEVVDDNALVDGGLLHPAIAGPSADGDRPASSDGPDLSPKPLRPQPRSSEPRSSEPLSPESARRVRAAVYEAGVLAVDEANARIGAIAPLDDDAVAWLALLLVNIPVRDYAWDQVGRDVEGSVGLWTDIVRRVERELAAAPATLLAFAAWRNGDGAIASIALDRALDADPDYSMAQLLLHGIDNGLPPRAWLDVPPPGVPRPARRRRSGSQGRRPRRVRVIPPGGSTR